MLVFMVSGNKQTDDLNVFNLYFTVLLTFNEIKQGQRHEEKEQKDNETGSEREKETRNNCLTIVKYFQ